MFEGTSAREEAAGTFALAGLCLGLFVYVFLRWFRAGPVSPDPWDETISAQIESPGVTALCHRCVTPHADSEHFCPNCGVAVGDYNNVLPFEQLFSEGEVLRNGTTQPFRPTFLILAGYLLMSTTAYMVFAPVYWFFLFRNLIRHPMVPLELRGSESLPPRD
jgi:hypothetical protein